MCEGQDGKDKTCKGQEGIAEVTVVKAPRSVYIGGQQPSDTALYLAYPSIKDKI